MDEIHKMLGAQPEQSLTDIEPIYPTEETLRTQMEALKARLASVEASRAEILRSEDTSNVVQLKTTSTSLEGSSIDVSSIAIAEHQDIGVQADTNTCDSHSETSIQSEKEPKFSEASAQTEIIDLQETGVQTVEAEEVSIAFKLCISLFQAEI